MLEQAHKCLWSRWTARTHNWWVIHRIARAPSDDYCNVTNGLLYRIHPRACTHRFDSLWLHHNSPQASSEFERTTNVLMNVDQGMIISARLKGWSSWRDSTARWNSEPPAAWPDLVFSQWSRVCRQHQRPIASLQSIFFGDVIFPTTKVIQAIADYDSNLFKLPGSTNTPVVRYNSSDDNFYALLGTGYGASIMDMLVFHANEFATGDESTGAVTKIKSVREIQLAGRPYTIYSAFDSRVWVKPPEPTGRRSVVGEKMVFDMLITLEDVEAPPDMEKQAKSITQGPPYVREIWDLGMRDGSGGGRRRPTPSPTGRRPTSSPTGSSYISNLGGIGGTSSQAGGSSSLSSTPSPTLPACCQGQRGGGQRGGGWRNWFCFCGSMTTDD